MIPKERKWTEDKILHTECTTQHGFMQICMSNGIHTLLLTLFRREEETMVIMIFFMHTDEW